MLKVTLIGYNTYNTNNRFVGGTEMITDTLLRYFLEQVGARVQWIIASGLSKELRRMYEDDYQCAQILHKSEATIDTVRAWNPDLVVVSICSFNTKILCKELISQIDFCPVLVYGHGPNCCSISNYTPEFAKSDNAYFSYLSNKELMQFIKYGVTQSHTFSVTNPVLFDHVEVKKDPQYQFDVMTNARLVPQKGVSNVAKLCNKLDYSLVMVGGRSRTSCPELDAIKLLGCNYQYMDVVPRDTVLSLLRKSKFLGFLPISQEGESPLVVLEAMSQGVPIITWDNFGIKNIVDPAHNIILDYDKDHYIDQFIEEYLPHIDEYLSFENRMALSKSVVRSFGIKAYHKKLTQIFCKITDNKEFLRVDQRL